MMTYLPDDLLVKTDIASMAVSLELRVPMLDHELVELGLSLPQEMTIRRRRGKQALRMAFADLLPPEVFTAKKRGFGLPVGDWLRGELQPAMRETLLDSSFLDADIVRGEAVRGLVNDHSSGRDDHTHRLWALIMLAKWLSKGPGQAPAP
jgi:asparagine synthase (glutamine-hydrolysing)